MPYSDGISFMNVSAEGRIDVCRSLAIYDKVELYSGTMPSSGDSPPVGTLLASFSDVMWDVLGLGTKHNSLGNIHHYRNDISVQGSSIYGDPYPIFKNEAILSPPHRDFFLYGTDAYGLAGLVPGSEFRQDRVIIDFGESIHILGVEALNIPFLQEHVGDYDAPDTHVKSTFHFSNLPISPVYGELTEDLKSITHTWRTYLCDQIISQAQAPTRNMLFDVMYSYYFPSEGYRYVEMIDVRSVSGSAQGISARYMAIDFVNEIPLRYLIHTSTGADIDTALALPFGSRYTAKVISEGTVGYARMTSSTNNTLSIYLTAGVSDAELILSRDKVYLDGEVYITGGKITVPT